MESDKHSSVIADFVAAITQHKLSARRVGRMTNNILSWRTVARVLHNHSQGKKQAHLPSTIAQLDRVTLVLCTTRATGVLTDDESSDVARRANDLQYRMVYQSLYPNN